LPIEIKTSDKRENIRLISSYKIDCAFIALHGFFGEDGQIQGLLDGLGIPYTGSGKSASELAMDKVASRKIFAAAGIAVPRYELVKKSAYQRGELKDFNLQLPWVIKPCGHGSSVGLSIIDKREDLEKGLEFAFGFDEQALVEEYLPGREITVGILAEKALPVIEIVPKNRFFDYQAKYTAGMTDYIVPAQLEESIAAKAQEAALLAHKSLGCSGCSRVDMILNKDNAPVVLELNSIPGLTAISLLPKAARLVGIEFPQLCLKLIQLAYEKAEIPLPR
jgi:D-alanine--D-alanine ligase